MLMTVANAFLLRLAKAAHMVTMEICSYHAVITGRCSMAFLDIFQVCEEKDLREDAFPSLNIMFLRVLLKIA